MADFRQSPKYASFMEKIGWWVKRLDGCQVFIKKFPLTGSIVKIQRPEKIPFGQIDRLAKKYRALFVKVEPVNPSQVSPLTYHGFKPSSPLLPTKTTQIDLTPAEEAIFAQFKKDCRYEIRKVEKNKIIVKKSSDIDAFIKLWQKNALRRGFWIPIGGQIRALWQAFGQDAYLLSANSLAGALIVIHDKWAYYSYAASTTQGRQLAAPYLVVWQAIKLAKRAGCQIFDFEGIYDERFPQKSWLGFSHFKKSFAGKEVFFPGCWLKWYNPFHF